MARFSRDDHTGAGSGLSRRFFLRAGVAASGGLLMGVSLLRADADAGGHGDGFTPDAYVHIAPDDTVTLTMPSVEMGQGVYTAVPMILAEELDLDLDRVKLEHAPVDAKAYGNPLFGVQMTGGSTTVRGWWTPLRKAGASARTMLVQAAANGWGVEPSSCVTDKGVVSHPQSGRSATYGALASRAAGLKPPQDPPLKDPKAFRLVGRPHRRLDSAEKVNGAAVYGIDARPEGVKIATLASSPTFGGTVAKVDQRQALAVPGVRQVVVLDDTVAVVGDHMWAALQGLEALGVEWNDGPNAKVGQADLWAGLAIGAQAPGVVAQKLGDPAATLAQGHVYAATYELPYLAHAAMEPMNCTVHVRPGSCEIWVGTQVMGMAQAAAAKAADLQPDQVTVHNHLIGGGFGRRLEVDGVARAVRIARHVEGPVKVVWTREEDIQQEWYRPLYHNRMQARVENGQVVAWHHRVTGPSILARYLPPAFVKGIDSDAVDGAVDQPYDFPNVLVEFVRHEQAVVPLSFWRGVGPNSNVFSAECFIDYLAHETRVDPVAFRRRMLTKNPRALATLNLAAEKAGWDQAGAKPAGPERTGRGVALLWAFGSYLATIADVTVADDGEARVTRLVCAVDAGIVVNPDGLIAQIQGGMIFGLSAVLHGEVTIAGGRVQQSNFHDYRVLRIDETPAIEVYLVPSGEAPGGIGEPGTVVVQPAVANAVFAATGVQLNRMPIKRDLIARRTA